MEKTLKYIQLKFGNVKNFLISGSSITQDKNDFSDIDIVIFLLTYQFHKTIRY